MRSRPLPSVARCSFFAACAACVRLLRLLSRSFVHGLCPRWHACGCFRVLRSCAHGLCHRWHAYACGWLVVRLAAFVFCARAFAASAVGGTPTPVLLVLSRLWGRVLYAASALGGMPLAAFVCCAHALVAYAIGGTHMLVVVLSFAVCVRLLLGLLRLCVRSLCPRWHARGCLVRCAHALTASAIGGAPTPHVCGCCLCYCACAFAALP